MIRRAVGAAWLAVAVTACGPRTFTPPIGPGESTDASAAWSAATATCRSATTYMARLRVSGRAGQQRISRLAGLAADTAVTRDQIYMSATVAGQPIFVLAGSASEATLWLRSDKRVVKAPAGEIIEAILGLPVPPDRLLALLTGCVTRSLDVTAATRYGERLAVQTSDARVYLDRQELSWRTLAGEAEGFVVLLEWKSSPVPTKLWLNSTPGREPRATLQVSVDDPAVNGTIPPGVFSPPAGAATAEPMTLEELRAGGLGRKKD